MSMLGAAHQASCTCRNSVADSLSVRTSCLASWMHTQRCASVKTMPFTLTHLNSFCLQGLRCETLGALAALSGLTELDMSLCRGVGEGTLASLQGLQQLRVLNASVCPSLTDAGLEVSDAGCTLVVCTSSWCPHAAH